LHLRGKYGYLKIRVLHKKIRVINIKEKMVNSYKELNNGWVSILFLNGLGFKSTKKLISLRKNIGGLMLDIAMFFNILHQKK